MSMNLRRWLVAAAVLVAVGSALAVTPTSVVAQIRAALVKNVDEPWRTPWETRTEFLPNGGGCYTPGDCFNYLDGSGFARFELRAVPAGKRWVVVSATGGLVNGDGRTQQIWLGTGTTAIVFDGVKWMYGGPFYPGTSFSMATFSSEVHATFGPGEVPVVRVFGSPSLVGYTSLVFKGYLIDAM